MQPQGTGVINPSFIQSITAQVHAIAAPVESTLGELELDSAAACAQLQALVNTVMADLQAEITAVKESIATLLPLTTLPHDLSSVISWITAFATPQIEAYNRYVAQLSAMLAEITNLVSEIESAAGRILHCSVTIPPIAP
jgi:hypothetical protein